MLLKIHTVISSEVKLWEDICIVWTFQLHLVSTLAPAMKGFSWCPSHTYRELLQTIAEEAAQCSVAIEQKFSSMSLHEFLGPDLCIHAASYFNTYSCGTSEKAQVTGQKASFLFWEEDVQLRKIRVLSALLIRKEKIKNDYTIPTEGLY